MTAFDYVRLVGDSIKAVAPIIACLLVIIGWKVVRRENANRDNRQELRSTVASLTADINALVQKSHEYYVLQPCEKATISEIEINRDLDAVAARLDRLKRMSGLFQHDIKLTTFRHALTGGDFEQKSREARPPSDRKYGEISLAAKELIDDLESKYSNLYYSRHESFFSKLF